MRVATRETDGTLIVGLIGPFPHPREDLAGLRNSFRDALSGRTANFIITLSGMESLTSEDIGVLISLLHHAEMDTGGSGGVPFVRVVATNDRVAAALRTMDGPIWVFETEEEALASLQGRSGNWFWGAVIAFTLVLFFLSHCAA